MWTLPQLVCVHVLSESVQLSLARVLYIFFHTCLKNIILSDHKIVDILCSGITKIQINGFENIFW